MVAFPTLPLTLRKKKKPLAPIPDIDVLDEPWKRLYTGRESALMGDAMQRAPLPTPTPFPPLKYPEWIANAPSSPAMPTETPISTSNLLQKFGQSIISPIQSVVQQIQNIPEWADFVSAAKDEADKEGFPLAVLLGQAAIETGRNPYNAPGNNWFGIKGRGSGGINVLGTQEATPAGQYYSTRAGFRAYNSARESIRDYINLIKTDPRYARAWGLKNNPVQMIQEIHRAGYATSPTYSQDVINTPDFRSHLDYKPTPTPTPTATPAPTVFQPRMPSNIVSPLPRSSVSATPTIPQRNPIASLFSGLFRGK